MQTAYKTLQTSSSTNNMTYTTNVYAANTKIDANSK
jgi:hypothetical protein